MSHPLIRTEILLGPEGLEDLAGKHVLIAGVGGVGGAAAEAIARSGVGEITLIDHDVVSLSNLNRQVVALHSTLGQPKTEVMAARIRDINPHCRVHARTEFLHKDQAAAFVAAGNFDFVLDCIDSLSCKTALVAACLTQGVPVASSMGAGGRLDVTQVRVASLNQTRMCALAREMRANLRKLGIPANYPVIYSEEQPLPPLPPQPLDGPIPSRPRAVNGTISYMPALFGTMLAGVAVKALTGGRRQEA
ncbi:tRNA threonylcarbamoyladenosine dehydratase [Thermithiobacillus tepidarius DSM 3134]|uniref:tRNA threonylcarbamoyladenosine dehydratase n=1 Tax=Thermithiobacillus tepidarius TaxID=929 RepID=UPI000423AF2B|nr:tRNA threonylcarbamoyladenosine dehydratase [Thermithiobacillus tepidarius]